MIRFNIELSLLLFFPHNNSGHFTFMRETIKTLAKKLILLKFFPPHFEISAKKNFFFNMILKHKHYISEVLKIGTSF